MATATRVRLTPKDHGREIDPELFEHSTGEEGYHYKLIDGRVYVSPLPDLPNDSLENWLADKLRDYSREHPAVLNFVTVKSRIYIPTRKKATRPEPDISAYQDFPHHLPRRERRWQDISPVLVVEVISDDDPDKDLAATSSCTWRCRRSRSTGCSTHGRTRTGRRCGCTGGGARTG